jgi:hypothetical protein
LKDSRNRDGDMDRLVRSLIVGIAAFTIDYLAAQLKDQAKARVALLVNGYKMDDYSDDVLEELR